MVAVDFSPRLGDGMLPPWSDGWARTGLYAYPEPAQRDVDWIARHTLHELHHHLADVHRVLEAVLGG